ncbi:E3 ubiquitin-protein [Vigna angularis]|uniref:RING-type E3 ubiquitin transferase n=2 Tax=Phaseolus angularis TaxID=3914 RepID=A0A8T0KQH1_PHAAN|nr:probable E3 ubiquitin-protein ligase RHG1A [Vigna angularis]XP_052731967.1 probable E3 ubiquitin-protein ligase RHG1A [Vigna angularis]XP_052731968.1 probable E3 ubiquitin-protein ligase RHG1A [Vigna angularis]KAG2400553.1 E3 ubiquitin-protein [Vigna angularis]
MQGQRGTVGPMPETLEFDCGSTPGNSTVDQQICWNNVNPAENQIPDYILSPGNMNSPYVNSIDHEWQNLSGWSLGEPSSSNTPNEINNNEPKREVGWTSTITAGALPGARLEERRLEPTNTLSLDNDNTSAVYMRSPESRLMSQNLNLNAGLADSGDDNSQHLELPNLHMSSGSSNERLPSNVGSGSFLLPSANSGFLVEGSDGRPSSLDTRRVSCKRKALEGNNGQSSDAGSSSYNQHADGSVWHAIPTQDNAGSSSNRAVSSEQVNARLGLGMGNEASENVPDSNIAGSSESFHRNFRLRLNPLSQQSSVPPTAFSTGSTIRQSGVSSSSQASQRFHSVDNSLNLRSAPPIDNVVPQSQPLVIHVPALPRNRQSFRWNGGSSSRNIHASNPVICADRDQEDASSRRMSRNILEHPVFVPATDLRNLVQNPTVRASSSSSENLSIPGNVSSSSRTGSNPATNPSPASNWVSRPNPPQHPRRLSEYVRRSLFSPGSDPIGNPSNAYSSLRSALSTSEPRPLSSGTGANPRSSPWMDRQGESEFGIPYSLRALDVASEGGSSRLVSELRNMLGIMRRGGNVRFEDVVILDHQSFLSGIADVHDRHRDMRLDVDNMSYEELLALEERIGNVSTGLSEEAVLKLLKQKKHSVESESPIDAEPCCVCQEDYGDGDDIGTLDCGHDFHSDCIKQWLMHKNLCPICKTTGLAT